MISTPKSGVSALIGRLGEDRDHSLVGSLGIVVICLGVLATLFI